jgi:serine protease Do
MNELIQFGEVRRGSIGYVELAPVTTRSAEQMGMPGVHGALVTAIHRRSAAYRAGIQPGDIIVEFNGQKVDDPSQLQRLIKDAEIGKAVNVAIIREGRETRLKVQVQSTAARAGN